MPPSYLAAVLDLLTHHPLALLACALRLLVRVPFVTFGAYTVYRMCGGTWDGLWWSDDFAAWVGTLRFPRPVARGWARVGWAVLVACVAVWVVAEL